MHTNPLLLHPILVDSNAKSHKLLANLMRRMQNLTIINCYDAIHAEIGQNPAYSYTSI